ncbi:MAG TPA: hypothetical protein VIK11_03325 [Tepidiformaceae bacterium]|jgi:hypothetical protein
MTKPEPRSPARHTPTPVLVVLPSLVSGVGVIFILVAIIFDAAVVRAVCLSIGVVLLWLDFFITMAIFRYTVRSIDRRLGDLERRESDGAAGASASPRA